jgi:hypothetical protein
MPGWARRGKIDETGAHASSTPHFVSEKSGETAQSLVKRGSRWGLNNVALTIIGKGGTTYSEACRSAEHVARDAQSAQIA